MAHKKPNPVDTETLNAYLYEHESADGTYIRITIAADLEEIKRAQDWLKKIAEYIELSV